MSTIKISSGDKFIFDERVKEEFSSKFYVKLMIENFAFRFIAKIQMDKNVFTNEKTFKQDVLKLSFFELSKYLESVNKINIFSILKLGEVQNKYIDLSKINFEITNGIEIPVKESLYSELLFQVNEVNKIVNEFDKVKNILMNYSKSTPIIIKSDYSRIQDLSNFLFQCIECSGEFFQYSSNSKKINIIRSRFIELSNRKNPDNAYYKHYQGQLYNTLFQLTAPSVWKDKPNIDYFDQLVEESKLY